MSIHKIILNYSGNDFLELYNAEGQRIYDMKQYKEDLNYLTKYLNKNPSLKQQFIDVIKNDTPINDDDVKLKYVIRLYNILPQKYRKRCVSEMEI